MNEVFYYMFLNIFLDHEKNVGKNLKYLQSNSMILSLVFKYCSARLFSRFDESRCTSFLINCANNDRVNKTYF